MGEAEKGTRRLKIGMVISVVVMLVLATSNIWFYLNKQSLESLYNDYIATHSHTNSQYDTLYTEYDALNTTYQDYVATHSHTNSEYDSLNTAYQKYVATHSMSDSEYNALKAERDALKAPRLSALSLYAEDVRPSNATPYLHIYGEVWNVGTDTAYDCKLHVVAYRGWVNVIDTYVSLGTIWGENRKSVDSNIYYSGGALSDWSIIPVWNA